MKTTIRSIISQGPDGVPVEIECHLANSLPNIVIVGYAAKAVEESRERLRGAFANSGLLLPRKRISINLAPADIPKDSSSLDLAIASAILAAQMPVIRMHDHSALIGELGLDGTVRPVRGIIGKLLSGRHNGITHFYIPADTMAQASLVPGVCLIAVSSLKQLHDLLTGASEPNILRTGNGRSAPATAAAKPDVSLSDIIGQDQAKRALQIAAAGGHNILLSGPPGTGKSMLAKALAGLLPPLSHEEIMEVTHLHSLAGHNYEQLVTARPFRAPHHSASHAAVVGGGNNSRPGEISLAHRGVLLFDEMPEFSRATLESLRQPLEDHTITVSRARESNEYPANFILVGTANPCPCGYHDVSQRHTDSRRCQCSPHIIQHYRRKLSGPLLDRIDLCVTVERTEHDKLLSAATNNDYDTSIKKLVTEARAAQHARFANDSSSLKLNSDMTNRDLKQLAGLAASAKDILDTASRQLGLSARAYMRCIKVARTIADLDHAVSIEPYHITEALQYRAGSLFGP